MQEYKNLSGLPVGEQVLWHRTLTNQFLIRDVRKILCWHVHQELRFNLLEWLARRLRTKIQYATRKALKLALRKVVGEHLTWKDFSLDGDFELQWLTEFSFRVHPDDYFEDSNDTQEEVDDSNWRPSLASPSDPEGLHPRVHPSFRLHLSEDLQLETLVHLGPQAICDVIVACYGRGDKAWDGLCVKALEESVERGVFAFVREALADDLKLHFSEEATSEYWDNEREDIVSALWGFPGPTGDLYGHQYAWWTAGFHRAHVDTDRERYPAMFLDSPQDPVGEEQEPPVPSGWEDRSTGWGSS